MKKQNKKSEENTPSLKNIKVSDLISNREDAERYAEACRQSQREQSLSPADRLLEEAFQRQERKEQQQAEEQDQEEEIRTLDPIDPQALSEEERLREEGWNSYMERMEKQKDQKEESPKGKKLVMLQPILRKLPEESPKDFAKRAMEGLGAMFGEEMKINETPQTEPETHDPEAG